MKLICSMRLVVAGVLFLTTAGSALAGNAASPVVAEATASFTQIRIELVDLDASDGIDPSFGPGPSGGGISSAQAGIRSLGGADLGFDLLVGGFEGLPIDDATAHVAAGNDQAHATRGGDGLHTSVAVGADRNAQTFAWFDSDYTSEYLGGDTFFTGLFELSPQTELRISAAYHVLATITALPGIDDVTAFGNAMLTAQLGTTNINDLQRATAESWTRLYAGQLFETGELTGSLTLTVANHSDVFAPLMLGAMASSYANVAAMSPVPEPGAAWLAALGLWVVWRRSGQAPRAGSVG